MLFIVGLVGVAIWNLLRIFMFGTVTHPDVITSHKFINLVLVGYYIMFAYVTYIITAKGDPKHETLIKYFAFT